ncbi:hypothetical protein ACFW6F_32920 [Streptomyces sp. NPDC058746]|uniref:hypothetical protein n=1 Tax=Streptomyces sp. NPDC058746 TaxID=3346622 RepID=UPI00369D37C8
MPARPRTQTPLLLGDYISAPTRGPISSTPYGSLDTLDLADFLVRWPELHSEALAALGQAVSTRRRSSTPGRSSGTT